MKCNIIYNVVPALAQRGDPIGSQVVDSICMCVTHQWEFRLGRANDYCPLGELEARIEYLEEKLKLLEGK